MRSSNLSAMLNSISLIFMIVGSALASVETNKRGGHGMFHGLQEGNGKSSWLEESKVENVKITQGNTNSLLSNGVPNSNKKSSLYLQPEPRGLDYLLGVPDQNPLIFRKRDLSHENEVINNMRKKRQINSQPGYVIPGSMGQAVLFGVPNGNGFSNLPNGNGPSNLPNGNGFSNLPNGNGFPNSPNGNSFSNLPNGNYPNGNGFSNGNNGFSNLPNGMGSSSFSNGNNFQNGGFPQGINGNSHIGGYKTHGY